LLFGDFFSSLAHHLSEYDENHAPHGNGRKVSLTTFFFFWGGGRKKESKKEKKKKELERFGYILEKYQWP